MAEFVVQTDDSSRYVEKHCRDDLPVAPLPSSILDLGHRMHAQFLEATGQELHVMMCHDNCDGFPMYRCASQVPTKPWNMGHADPTNETCKFAQVPCVGAPLAKDALLPAFVLDGELRITVQTSRYRRGNLDHSRNLFR